MKPLYIAMLALGLVPISMNTADAAAQRAKLTIEPIRPAAPIKRVPIRHPDITAGKPAPILRAGTPGALAGRVPAPSLLGNNSNRLISQDGGGLISPANRNGIVSHDSGGFKPSNVISNDGGSFRRR